MDYKSTWNLSTIPDDLLMSEAGRRQAARRTAPLGGFREGSGRKPQWVRCPRCGQTVTKTQARRGHGC